MAHLVYAGLFFLFHTFLTGSFLLYSASFTKGSSFFIPSPLEFWGTFLDSSFVIWFSFQRIVFSFHLFLHFLCNHINFSCCCSFVLLSGTLHDCTFKPPLGIPSQSEQFFTLLCSVMVSFSLLLRAYYNPLLWIPRIRKHCIWLTMF